MSGEKNHPHVISSGGGETMLDIEQWSTVWALAKMGYSIRKIVRELAIDRNTVRKYYGKNIIAINGKLRNRL